MTGWAHPRIPAPDAAKDDWLALSIEAQESLERRRQFYGVLTARGATSDELASAKAEGAAWAEIARDWHWIATGEGQHADADSLAARIDAIDAAIGRFFQLIDQQGQATRAQNAQIARLASLRWWAEREANLPFQKQARWLASVGHHWRAENGHPTLGAMIASRTDEKERKAA